METGSEKPTPMAMSLTSCHAEYAMIGREGGGGLVEKSRGSWVSIGSPS
jgi:hypothetical protein